MVRSAAWLAAVVWFACVGVANAEGAVGEAAQGMVGGWEISNTDRDRRCTLTFSVDAASGGFKIDFDSECGAAFPRLGQVVAWRIGADNALRLFDAKGSAVMEFNEVESGMFESERGPEGLLFLQTQAALKVEIRTPQQMTGDWALLRELGKPLCRLTLSRGDGGAGSESYRVIVQLGCDKAIAAFGLTEWRLDRDQLVLTGSGGAWRFAESDAAIWERVPLSVDPMLLVRQ